MSTRWVVIADIRLEVDYTFHPGIRGRLTGPPEVCFEEEPAEVWINHIFHHGEDIFDLLSDYIITRIQDIIIEEDINDEQF